MGQSKRSGQQPSREEARAQRKQFEKECPHISMKEVAIKGGALAMLTAIAVFPWEKEYDKIKERRERDKEEKNGGGERKGNRDYERGSRDYERRGRERDERSDNRVSRRRQSEGGDRERGYGMYLDRDREYRPVEDAPGSSSSGSSSEGRDRYTGSDDGEYGRKYIEASRKERGRGRRGSEDGYRRRRRDSSADYEGRRYD